MRAGEDATFSNGLEVVNLQLDRGDAPFAAEVTLNSDSYRRVGQCCRHPSMRCSGAVPQLLPESTPDRDAIAVDALQAHTQQRVERHFAQEISNLLRC